MNSSLQLTWNKIIFTLLFFLSLSSLAQDTKLDSILNDYHNHPEQILVAAHRATNPNYPENSLAAISESIRIGVLQLTKGKMLLDVDFKLEGEAAVRQTFDLIETYGMEDQILFFLYDFPETKQYQKLNKDIKIMPRAYSRKDIRGIRKLEDISIIHIDESYYRDGTMHRLIKSGYRVWINALGKYDSMEAQEKNSGFDALLSRKYVNVIQTDLPEELLSYLRSKNLHR